jgi:L,D-transpeptidase YcbB
MSVRLAMGVAFSALFGLAPCASAQDAEQAAAPVAVDAGAPADPAAPDPLTPEEKDVPLLAPGAPAEKPAEVVEAPVAEPSAIPAQILARLASAGGKADAREDVSGMTAFYNQTKGQPVWTSRDGLTAKAQSAIGEIRGADDWGLDASAFALPGNPEPGAAPEVLADAELKLSLAVLKYARHARGGRFDPPSISPVIDRRPHIYEPKSVMLGIAAAESPDEYLRGLHPKHEQFKRLRQALIALKKTGGGEAAAPAIRIPPGRDFKPGDEDPQIGLLRKRLQAGQEAPRDTIYDTPLVEAVNRYRKEHGLDATGFIDRKLRASLNEALPASPADNRMRILVNMERWRWMPDNLGDFYVWNNLPEQLTRVLDHGKMALMERIVVGKPSSPTPTFTANMQFVIFHPEWGVPDGIKVNELAPKLRRAGGGGGFLFFGGGGSSEVLQRMGGLRVTQNGREVNPDSIDWSSVDIRRYQFVQAAGARNVLGVVKFRFPNKHDVYMHDTPDRHLFSSGLRAFSHGCMRTQNPVHLAEVLLAHDKGWSAEQVRSMAAAGGTNEITLSTQIPVHVAYFTAEVDDKGQLRTFGDLYGLDSKVASALKGEPVAFASGPAVSADNEERRRPERQEPFSRARDRDRWGPFGRPWNPFEHWN